LLSPLHCELLEGYLQEHDGIVLSDISPALLTLAAVHFDGRRRATACLMAERSAFLKVLLPVRAALKSELQAGRLRGIGEAILIELIGMLPSGNVGAEAQWLLSLLR
jgi:hypothetical protein